MKEKIKLKDFLKDFGVNIKDIKKCRDLIVDFFCFFGFKIIESQNYRYIKSVSQRGDGQGYEIYYIFQRKSDSKYFYYYIYDVRIEEDKLEECRQIVTTKWDFETNY